MNQIEEMRRQGLSVTAIAEVTGFDRKTVRKYLAHPDLEPRYKPRPGRPTLLDPLKSYIDQRLAAGVWNAVVLTRELKERGYEGGYSTVKEYLQPKRESARTAVVRRFETPPGRQAQVDWGHLGTLTVNEEKPQAVGSAGSLSISVELVDARDGAVLWRDQYSRSAADLLTVVQELLPRDQP